MCVWGGGAGALSASPGPEVAGGRERLVHATTAGPPEGSRDVENEAVGGLTGAHGIRGPWKRAHLLGSGNCREKSRQAVSKNPTDRPPPRRVPLSCLPGVEGGSRPNSSVGLGSLGPRLRSYLQRGCRLLFYPRMSPTATGSALLSSGVRARLCPLNKMEQNGLYRCLQ